MEVTVAVRNARGGTNDSHHDGHHDGSRTEFHAGRHAVSRDGSHDGSRNKSRDRSHDGSLIRNRDGSRDRCRHKPRAGATGDPVETVSAIVQADTDGNGLTTAVMTETDAATATNGVGIATADVNGGNAEVGPEP